MEQKILAFLKGKLLGTSEMYLTGVANHYSKTITKEEDIATTLDDGAINLLKVNANLLQSEGDRRATTATETAVRNFQEKHGLDENGIKLVDPTPPEPTTTDTNVPEWFKSHSEKTDKIIEDLRNTLSKNEEEKISTAMSEKIKSHPKLKGIPAEFLEGRSLTAKTEEEVEALALSIETNYTAFIQKQVEDGLVIEIPRTSDAELGDVAKREGENAAKNRNGLADGNTGPKAKEI